MPIGPDEEITVRATLKDKRRFIGDSKQVAQAIKDIQKSGRRADIEISKFNARLSFLGALLRIVRPVFLATAIGFLAQAASAGAGGIVALTSALSPLSGLLAAGVLGAGLFTQAISVLGFSLAGVFDAVGGLTEDLDPEKLAMLNPAAREFAGVLHGLKPLISTIQSEVQKGLFPGLTTALQILAPVIRTFIPFLRETAHILGMFAAQGAALMAGKWAKDFATLLQMNNQWLRELIPAAFMLASAFKDIVMAAIPLFSWIVQGVVLFAKWFRHLISDAKKSGQLSAFFRQTMVILSILIPMFKDLGNFIKNVFVTAYPLGKDILMVFQQGAHWLSEWSESAKGTRTLAEYFAAIKKPLWEIGRLVRDVAYYFILLGTSEGLTPLLVALRTELLPVLYDLLSVTTAELGPAFISVFTALVKLINQIHPALIIMLKTLAFVLTALANFVGIHPAVTSMVGAFLGVAGAIKLLRMLLLVTGIRSLVHYLMIMRIALLAESGALNMTTAAFIRYKIALVATTIWTKAVMIATKIWTAAVWLLNIALRANPIIFVITGLVALGYAVVTLYHKWAWFRRAVNNTWAWLRTAATNTANWIVNAFKNVVRWIQNAISWLETADQKKDAFLGKGKGGGLLGLGGIDKFGNPEEWFRAGGGPITSQTGGWAVVGEEGPELARFPLGTQIIPNNQMGPKKAAPAYPTPGISGRRSDIVVHVHSELDGRELGRSVVRVAQDAEARK